ncbi:Uncharacterised protein [Serratia liquefaciens]|nr:Uncharacterised protein [Serratia liquefaciens]
MAIRASFMPIRAKPQAKKTRPEGRVVTLTLCCLELVNQAHGNHVVGVDPGRLGEVVVVQQVDFVVNVGGHVFVEEVGRTQIHKFDQIFVAVILAVSGQTQVFTFGLF